MKKSQNDLLTFNANLKNHGAFVLDQLHKIDNPGPLVKSLAPHDFLVTWQMADDEQKADLLIIADKEQVELLIDLTCWTGDRPALGALEELVRPTVESGIGGATRVLHTLSDELKTLVLGQNARIHLLENRNDELQVPETSEIIACPDGYYFIEFPVSERVTNVERALWQALFLRPFQEYHLELESIRHEFPSNLEETAYRWRTGRLADFGFSVREDAMAILTPRTPEEVRRRADRAEPLVHPLGGSVTLPILYRENLRGVEFVDRAIETLLQDESPESELRRESMSVELTAIGNQFLTATGVEISDPEAIGRGIKKMRNLFAMGLFSASNGDLQDAVRLLKWVELAHFLQVGLGLVYPFRDRARKTLQSADFSPGGRKGETFDPPHYVALTCLAQDVPGFWPSLTRRDDGFDVSSELIMPRPQDIQAFTSEQEIQEFTTFLEEAEELNNLLVRVLECAIPLPPETPASILLLTCLANMHLGNGPHASPLLAEDAKRFYLEGCHPDKERFLREAMAELAPLCNVSRGGPFHPGDESIPSRRLLLRLLHIGYSRLKTGMLERSLLLI